MAFTSDLSVGEFALTASAGLRPLRMAGAAGVFRVPTVMGPASDMWPGQTAVYGEEADIWTSAKATVLDRLRQEAKACGADVVVGVSLRWRPVPDAKRTPRRRGQVTSTSRGSFYEFTATGTAMSRTGAHGNPPPAADPPVLTSLRVPEYWKLAREGFPPAGLVAATAVAVLRPRWEEPPATRQTAAAPPPGWDADALTDPVNGADWPEYGTVVRQAYSAALAQLRAAAGRLGATGVTGVEIERHLPRHSCDTPTVFAHATGTAIAAASSAGGTSGDDPSRASLTVLPVRHVSAQ